MDGDVKGRLKSHSTLQYFASNSCLRACDT